MDFIPDFSEEIWSWCAAFTNTVIVTNVFFYICLFKYWSAPNLSELTDERRMKIIAGMTSYLHVVITISLVAVVWTEETSLEYRGRNDVSSTAFAVTVGYMVGELLIVLMQWNFIGNWLIVEHHFACSFVFIYVYAAGTNNLLVVVWLMADYAMKLIVDQRSILYDPSLQTFAVSCCSLLGGSLVYVMDTVVKMKLESYKARRNRVTPESTRRKNTTNTKDPRHSSTSSSSAPTNLTPTATSPRRSFPSHEPNPTSHRVNSTSHRVNSTSHRLNPTSHRLNPTSHRLNPTSHRLNPTSHRLNPTSHRLNSILRLNSQRVKPTLTNKTVPYLDTVGLTEEASPPLLEFDWSMKEEELSQFPFKQKRKCLREIKADQEKRLERLTKMTLEEMRAKALNMQKEIERENKMYQKE